jgi:oxygen-independent coproporphyrinogen-3 oxidase
VKKGTPISRLEVSRFPDESVCWDMGRIMLEKLSKFGYKPWQPNQFVLGEKYVHRYLKSKWEGQSEVLGLGVSAYSYVNDFMYVNYRTLSQYYESTDSGKLPIWIGKKLSWEQQIAKSVVLGIKVLPNGIDKQSFHKRFGIPVEDIYSDIIERLEETGLIESNSHYLRLTEKGLLFADEVCIEFYAAEDKETLERNGATRYGSYLDPID